MRIVFWRGAAAAALLSLAATAASAQQGSFQATCRNIQTVGSVLTAECRDPSGKYHPSSINYAQCKGDIGNNNGGLFCNGVVGGAPAGNANGNGNAGRGNQAAGSGGNVTEAAGSFRATCRNIETQGSTLNAECRDSSGRYHGSSIGYTQCKGDIANSNGMLSCNGATATSNEGNNSRGGNFSGGDNGSGYRDQGGPGNQGGGPRYDDRPQGGYDNRGPGFGPPPPPPQFAPGPYPQFEDREQGIMRDIRDGERSGRLSRRDVRDFRDQLGDIQDHEAQIYRAQGRRLNPEDGRRIARDLDMLSIAIHRASR